MQQFTIAAILDNKVEHVDPQHVIYLVRASDTVLYVGQSSSIYDRLDSHVGLDWRRAKSVLGECVFKNLPQSRNWIVELYSLEDCEDEAVAYVRSIGGSWFNKEIYYGAGGGIDFAERAKIARYHPCLNTIYNTDPSPLPEYILY